MNETSRRAFKASMRCSKAGAARRNSAQRGRGTRPALAELSADIKPDAEVLNADEPAGRLALKYVSACLEADLDGARRLILDTLDQGMSAEAIYCKMLVPAQKEGGELWHVGDIAVAEERLVTETTRRAMTLIVERLSPRRSWGNQCSPHR